MKASSSLLYYTALTILVMFSTFAVLGFSLGVELKPAKAFFGVDAAIQISFTKIWETLKAIAKQFLLKFVAKFAIKIMQKLESLHVIKNILYYADALEFDQYLGNQLNKIILKPRTQADADKLASSTETNIAAIAATFEALPLNQLPHLQVEDLAFLNTPVVPECSDGVDNDRDHQIDFPQDADCSSAADTSERENDRLVPAPSQPKKGLTPEQERLLLRGAVALATGAVACGGFNERAFRNVAIYNAAKNRGVDPRRINPRSGNYYTDLAKYGSPLASPDFQELAMRDAAAQAEARARQAVQLELQSSGLKSLRAGKNNVTRTSQTVADFISASFDKAIGTQIAASDSNFFANAIGGILADLVVNAIFKEKGRVAAENPYCGIANRPPDAIADPGLNYRKPPVGTGLIRVNGQDGVDILEGDTVTITWNASSAETGASIRIAGVPGASCNSATALSGSCTAAPEPGEYGVYLFLVADGEEQILGEAALKVLPLPTGRISAAGGQESVSVNWTVNTTSLIPAEEMGTTRVAGLLDTGCNGSVPRGSCQFETGAGTYTFSLYFSVKDHAERLLGTAQATATDAPSTQSLWNSPAFRVRE